MAKNATKPVAKASGKTNNRTAVTGKPSSNGQFGKGGGGTKKTIAKDAPMSEADRLTVRAWKYTYKNRDKRLD